MNIIYTPSRARLQCVRKDDTSVVHWLFLPGGPGLGSEYLLPLATLLQSEQAQLPGSFWLLDLPGDGSNTTSNCQESFQHWSQALLEAVSHFQHVVLVAHSTGGMYALATPKLEPHLNGLILLDSAHDAGWQTAFGEYVKKHPLPEIEFIEKQYRAHPSNELLKKCTLASSAWLFTPQGMETGKKMLVDLPYNYETCQWSEEHFDRTYQAKWVPQKIPTLILGGEEDHITPFNLFLQAKEFHQKNILFTSIKQAGHFPWIEKPNDVRKIFHEYSLRNCLIPNEKIILANPPHLICDL